MPFYASGYRRLSGDDWPALQHLFRCPADILSNLGGLERPHRSPPPIMLLSTLGAAAAYILFGLAETFHKPAVVVAPAGRCHGRQYFNCSGLHCRCHVPGRSCPRNGTHRRCIRDSDLLPVRVLATALIHPVIPEWFAAAGLESFSAWIQTHTYALPAFFCCRIIVF